MSPPPETILPPTPSQNTTTRSSTNQKRSQTHTSRRQNERSSENKKASKQLPLSSNHQDSETLDSIKELTGGKGYFPTKFRKGINHAVYKNVPFSEFSSWIVGGSLTAGHMYALFYLSHVYEDIKDKPGSHVPDLVLLSIPIFFISIVAEVAYDSYYKLGLYRPNDAISSLSSGSVQVLTKKIVESFWGFFPYAWIYDNFGVKFWFLESGPVAWWLMFLSVEFGYYWVHRTGHTMHLFWAMHGVHHSSEEYNLTTALRQSVVHGFFSWMFYMPFSFFFPPKLFLLHLQFNLLYQFWIHTQVIRKLGPLEWILNTPSQHRVHHGRNQYCIDKNYGGTLCIYDRLFGTFQEEIEEVPICYGLTHSINTFDPITPNYHIFQNIFRSMGLISNPFAKLSVFWYGPGWVTGTSPPQEYPIPPATRHTHQKFNTFLSRGLNLYVIVEFGIILALVTFALSYPSKGIFSGLVMVLTFYLIFALHSFGCLLDRAPNALTIEFVRLFIGALFLLYSRSIIQDVVGVWVVYLGLVGVVVSAYVINQFRPELSIPLRTFEIGCDYDDAASEEQKQLKQRRY